MTINNHLKMGVIGVGHLGRFHVQQLQTIQNINLIGIFDVDSVVAFTVASEFNTQNFEILDELLDECDAVSIVTPTSFHYDIAVKCIEKGCHLFIEKPITETIQQAQKLLEKANKTIIQVGHIERFNPAFLHLQMKNINPQFVEMHRLAPFNPRGTDVPVMLDLMIHDIDILLSMVKSEIKNIHASGVNVASSTCDIANARINFENGCVANLTASRISRGSMRKMRIFQESSYITVDFLEKSVEVYDVSDELPSHIDSRQVFPLEGEKKKYIIYQKPEIEEHNALRKELSHFADSVLSGQTPEVDGVSATRALQVAISIQQIIDGK